MKKCRIFKNIFFTLFVLIVLNCIFAINSKANYSGFKRFNNSPRVKILLTNSAESTEDNLSNKYIYIRITDYNTLSEDKIKFTIEDDSITPTLCDKPAIEGKKENSCFLYRISKQKINKLMKKKKTDTLEFEVQVTDNTENLYQASGKMQNTVHMNFIIKKKKNETYAINNSPRVRTWTYNASKKMINFVFADYSTPSNIVVTDLNSNKDVLSIKKASKFLKGENTASLNISKLTKTADNIYKLKIYVKDKTGREATRTVWFIEDNENIVSDQGGSGSSDINVNKKDTSGDKKNEDENQTGKIKKFELDKTVLMLDSHHYNFSDLKATVEPSNVKVRFTSSNEKVATVTPKKGRIRAKGYGTAKITATATLGGETKTIVCNVRVITTMKDKTSDSGEFHNYRENGAVYRTYYIRYNTSVKGSIKKDSKGTTISQHWSDAEVESYINNAAYLIRTYPDVSNFYEAREQTYHYYGNEPSGSGGGKTLTKPAKTWGTNYIVLFTTKNQCLYLLKKNEDGVWKLDEKTRSSGGYFWGTFYFKRIAYSNQYSGGNAFHPYRPGESGIHHTNCLHLGVIPGYPTSGGCIHIASSREAAMYKKLSQIFRVDKQMISLIYY